MTVANAIKKLEKSGLKPYRVGNVVFARNHRLEISFLINGREEDNYGITAINVRGLGDKSDSMRDYCAGVFYDNLTQALRSMNN